MEVLENRHLLSTLTPTTFADGGLGSGSLRDAVLQLNADAGTEDDTIQLLPSTYTLTIRNTHGHENEGLEGDLDLTQTRHRWIIQGAGPSTVIDASQLQDRVFQIVNPGIQVVFQDLVIQGGLAQDNGTEGALPGTTDALGGGILNNGGDLALDHVVLQNNVARGGDTAVRRADGHSALGGGIYSTGGALTVTEATIANNQATGGRGGDSSRTYYRAGAGGSASGAGLYASGGSLDVSDSRIMNNQATGGRGGDGRSYYTWCSGSCTHTLRFGGAGGGALGGGLYVNGGSLTVASSTIASNRAAGGPAGVNGSAGTSDGAGLYYSFGGAIAMLTSSTVSGNTASFAGGGIYNDYRSTLTVSDSTLSDNSADDGGAIYNAGTLTVSTNNVSGNYVGAGSGGGIYNMSTLTVSDSTLSGNSARDSAGGIYNGGTLTVSNSTLSGNSATGPSSYGGGIYNAGYPYSATLTVSNSTLSGNSAYYGGGISNFGTLTVSDSTLSGNSANGNGYFNGPGGGIYNYTGTLTVSNSTLSGNSASYGGGIYTAGTVFRPSTLTVSSSTLSKNFASAGGGLYIYDGYSVSVLHNTLIAGNFRDPTGTTRDDVSGELNFRGSYNLIGDGTGMTGLSNGVNGNLVGSASAPIDPLLGPLADNGGPTLTHALLSGSPAIDAGDNTDAPEWDQRGPGFRRIVNGTIDIGAFEVQAHAHGRPTGQPLPDPVPVQPQASSGGPLLSQVPGLPADPAAVPGPGLHNGPVGRPATFFTAAAGSGGRLAASFEFLLSPPLRRARVQADPGAFDPWRNDELSLT
jgi:hypothetical protein